MSATKPKVLRGRQFFANPGPTNIPDSVLRAIDRPTIDFHDPDFIAIYHEVVAGLKRVLGTSQHLFMYTGSGHAAWEATITNLLSPGDTILVLESGYFSEEWARMAAAHAVEVRTVAADWRRGVDMAQVAKALAEDRAHRVRAVCVVHNETATGLFTPIQEVRRAMEEARHPALLLVDTISSLGSIEFRMDAWGIDGVVGGSQKGLMCPTGTSFTAVSDKAMAAHKTAKLARFYFDWTRMLGRPPHNSFIGTVPVNAFYGLRESLRLIEEEGIDNLVARHHYLAEGVRRAVQVWAGNDGPQLFCTNPQRYSDSVTAVWMPDGSDAEAVRRVARGRYNVSLGGGLGPLGGRVFRIGHLGDLNEAMVLGALTAVEMSLRVAGIPHGRGGVEAAMAWFAVAMV
ncbi:MAG: aminotransferase class V-fold PLP-dependent enzyme [Acetobacteraceae bacterium]